jgi:hypothetical protein
MGLTGYALNNTGNGILFAQIDISSLARWINAPPQGLGLVRDNMMLNHNVGSLRTWIVSLFSYRIGNVPRKMEHIYKILPIYD